MDLGLQGQVAVIFGAARGIGLAIAEAFHAEGSQLVLVDRDSDVKAAADTLGAESFLGDLTDFQEVNEARDAVLARFGRVDHVIVAAGIGSGKVGFPYWNLSPEDWPKVLAVNLLGPMHVAHAFGPGLAEQGSGSLLFLTSVAGQIGSQTDPPYSAAKAGLINFMQCTARDLGPHGVRANCLSPGMVKTTLNHSVWEAAQQNLPEAERQSYEEWGRQKTARISAMGRWQEPSEFGAMAVYLASDHARSITGQTLNVDGGQVMHS